MVNVCGHSLCESCVELLFLKGSGSCPECNVPLKRSNFRVQLFEDPVVEKEVDIRRRVLRDFNKKEEDFPSLQAYNNYLEEIEDIIYNLVNGIDIIETNRKIDQYKKENKEIILKNKIKIGKEELELEKLIEMEKQVDEARKMVVIQEEIEQKRKKVKAKEALIDELMFSHGNAKEIVKSFSENGFEEAPIVKEEVVEKVSQFSTGVKFSHANQFLPIKKIEEGPLFVYQHPQFISDGPQPPDWSSLGTGQYLQHVRAETTDERAGGFFSKISCMRALQEAVVGLYFKNS